jgi:hypothetical protein
VPFFWTDQYDTRIRAYGIVSHEAEIQILSGDPDADRFIAACGHRVTVVGVIDWNSPSEIRSVRDTMLVRRSSKRSVSPSGSHWTRDHDEPRGDVPSEVRIWQSSVSGPASGWKKALERADGDGHFMALPQRGWR